MVALRNVLVILGLAALVAFLPGGGTASSFVVTLLSLAFLGSLGWFGAMLYRQHRVTLLSLEVRQRAILYGSVAIVVLAAIGTSRLWHSGPVGVLVWFVLVGGASFGVATVYRTYREY